MLRKHLQLCPMTSFVQFSIPKLYGNDQRASFPLTVEKRFDFILGFSPWIKLIHDSPACGYNSLLC